MSKSISIHSALALTPTETLEKGYQVPAGTVVSFAGAIGNLPAGWLHCDGSLLVKADFQELYNKIGDAHGASPLYFNLPDLRGRFVRGWDAGEGNDPDAAGRTVSNAGGASGDNVGSLQGDAFASHTHNIDVNNVLGASGIAGTNGTAGYPNNGITKSTGGSETRPKNVALLYIIKY